MRTRGVLFDLYGTLIVYGDMGKAWNAWYDVIYDAFRSAGMPLTSEEFRPRCAGFFEQPEPVGAIDGLTVVERRLHRLAGQVELFLDRAQARLAVESSIGIWHEYVHLDPEAIEVLGQLRRQRPLALVSNFDYAPYVRTLLVEWELEPLFDVVLVSDAVGVKKPQREIFDLAVQRLGLPAKELAHVGDSREDIEGASAAGIPPIWIDRGRRDQRYENFGAGTRRIQSLAELLHILD